MKKNILAVQMSSNVGKIEENFNKISSMVREFYSKNNFPIDIIILPEVWTTGWLCRTFDSLADDCGRTENFLSELAKKYNVNVIGGSYIRKSEAGCKNTCPVFNRKGELIARYEKIHLYSPDGEAQAVKRGQTPVVVNIEGLKIGLSICYDIRFPELFRSYINLKNPPEFLINMSAWPKTRAEQYFLMASSRAVENQAYFLALSQTGEIQNGVYNAGKSLLVEPMGNTIQRLNEDEGYIYGAIDTEVVQKVRNTYPNIENRIIKDFGFAPEILGEKAYV